MKLKQQLPKTAYPGNVLTFLAVITLTGIFLSPLVTGTGVHDGLRMGKIFFFAQWMLLVIPVGMVVFIREWKQPVGVLSLLVLLWFGWIIVRGKTGGIWHDEKFFWLAGCVVFFFVAVSICSVLEQPVQAERACLLALLVKLYDEIGQREKALEVAWELLEMEVKLESTAIEEIKAEMRYIVGM